MALPPIEEERAHAPRRSMAEFASGAVFGAALLASGVYAPGVITAQMRFQSNTMVVVMMGGSAMSAIVQDLGDRFKLLARTYPSPNRLGLFAYDANVLGGGLIGLGMGLTGSCPGTALVQTGMGMAEGGLVLVGGILGAAAFVRLEPTLDDLETSTVEADGDSVHASAGPSSKPRDLATALGVHPTSLLLFWVPMCLVVMRFAFSRDSTVRMVPPYEIVKPAYGGLLIGLAQLIATVFAGHTLGASAAYEDLARWIEEKTVGGSSQKELLLTPSVIFSGGVVVSAAVVGYLLQNRGLLANPVARAFGVRSAIQAVFGGVSMGFGSRLAKGCTSGHGISGLARFSMASLITTAALFSGGIITTDLTTKLMT